MPTTMPEFTLHVETEPTVDEDGMLRVADRLHERPGPLLGPSIGLVNVSEEHGRLSATFQVEADTISIATVLGVAQFMIALENVDVDADVELIEARAGGPDDD
ncbi:MAG: hypothetical protein R3C15_15585 [Thermoleophilia bacterium]